MRLAVAVLMVMVCIAIAVCGEIIESLAVCVCFGISHRVAPQCVLEGY